MVNDVVGHGPAVDIHAYLRAGDSAFDHQSLEPAFDWLLHRADRRAADGHLAFLACKIIVAGVKA